MRLIFSSSLKTEACGCNENTPDHKYCRDWITKPDIWGEIRWQGEDGKVTNEEPYRPCDTGQFWNSFCILPEGISDEDAGTPCP